MDSTVESHYDDADDADDAYDAIHPPLPPPKFSVEPHARSASPLRNGHSIAVPAVAVVPPPEEFTRPIAAPMPKSSPSKTSTLIEMYRERERGNQSSPVPLVPSRLPVRAGSLQPAPLGPRPISPARTISPSGSSASPSSIPVELDDSLVDPVRPLGFEDPGTMTPGRYVHGAPLHNVLEEEEEEVE